MFLARGQKKPESKEEMLVFFHGNASNHAGNVFIAAPYIRNGYGFVSVGYRGYNGDLGKPSEKNLYRDARATLNALIDSGVSEKNIVL